MRSKLFNYNFFSFFLCIWIWLVLQCYTSRQYAARVHHPTLDIYQIRHAASVLKKEKGSHYCVSVHRLSIKKNTKNKPTVCYFFPKLSGRWKWWCYFTNSDKRLEPNSGTMINIREHTVVHWLKIKRRHHHWI